MRTIPDMMRTDEVYVVAFGSIPHHCQDSELPTREHISASIESASTVLWSSRLTRFIERPERGLLAHGPVSGR